jgi:hypothetical protein
VEWDARGQVIRKARERLPYPKGASGEASLQSIGRFSGGTAAMVYQTSDSYASFVRTVVGFLKLVKLWKGLVVLPCLTSSIEVYGVRIAPWQMGNTTYG